jgi:hypothetical protein
MVDTKKKRCLVPLRLGDDALNAYIRYLVDPASSYMLVSKIKPCMSKHTPLNGEAANGSLQQGNFIRS